MASLIWIIPDVYNWTKISFNFQTNTVEVKQMEAKTLEKMIRFIYTDQVSKHKFEILNVTTRVILKPQNVVITGSDTLCMLYKMQN
jgi:hypothetical protein